MFKNILFLTIPSAIMVLLLLELVFRFVIPAANKPDLVFEEREKIIHFDPSTNAKGVFTVGRFALQRGKWSINNYGWNSPVDYFKEKNGKLRIAIVGDSFIESLMVDNTKTYPSLLRNYSSNAWEVYPFGISGAPLSQYLHMSRYAARHFDPDVFVINIVYNDFDESLSDFKRNPYFQKLQIDENKSVTEVKPVSYHLGWKKKLMKRSALVRYLYDNLKLRYVLKEKFSDTKTTSQNINANVNLDPIVAKKAKLELAVDYVLSKLRTENPGKEIILVMDGPRFDIYSNKLSRSNVLFLNQMVARAATSHQISFLDLTSVFTHDYQKNKRQFNSPYDSHWNEYGHKIAADTLYRFIARLRYLANNKSAGN